MIALNSKPFSLDVGGTGADDGLIAATPVHTGKATQISVLITFSADPGNCVFGIQGSLDGTNWIPIDDNNALTGTDDTPLGFSISNYPWIFVNVFQTSKDNDVTATITMVAI